MPLENHDFCTFLHVRCVRLQVDLYENGTIAIVEAVSPELGNRVQRVRVQLPGTSSELLNKFRDKKVDFAAHSNTEDGGAVFLNLLGELSCLVLLQCNILNVSGYVCHAPLALKRSQFMTESGSAWVPYCRCNTFAQLHLLY